MYGRGVAVSKSDFATYSYALLALKASGAELAGTVELHFTYDEEAGGGIGPGLAARAGHCRGRISRSRPASPTASPPPTTAACTSKSRSSASRRMRHGRIPASMRWKRRPACWRNSTRSARPTRRRSPRSRASTAPTLTVGLIAGGINTNVVPDKVTLRVDRRIIPEEDAAEAEATLTRQIRDAAANGPALPATCAGSCWPCRSCRSRVRRSSSRPSRVTRRRSWAKTVKSHGVPIYTDARLYSTAGIPTVLYGAGPHTLLEANGHRADEKLKLDDLYKATRVVALALADLLAPVARSAARCRRQAVILAPRGCRTRPGRRSPRRRRRPGARDRSPRSAAPPPPRRPAAGPARASARRDRRRAGRRGSPSPRAAPGAPPLPPGSARGARERPLRGQAGGRRAHPVGDAQEGSAQRGSRAPCAKRMTAGRWRAVVHCAALLFPQAPHGPSVADAQSLHWKREGYTTKARPRESGGAPDWT